MFRLFILVFFFLAGCGDERVLRVVSDIERGVVSVDQKNIGEIRVGYATAMVSSGVHQVEVKLDSKDGEWVFVGSGEVNMEADKATVIELETKKVPSKLREERLAKEEAARNAAQAAIEEQKKAKGLDKK